MCTAFEYDIISRKHYKLIDSSNLYDFSYIPLFDAEVETRDFVWVENDAGTTARVDDGDEDINGDFFFPDLCAFSTSSGDCTGSDLGAELNSTA